MPSLSRKAAGETRIKRQQEGEWIYDVDVVKLFYQVKMREMKCGGTQFSGPLVSQANHACQRDGEMAGRIIKFYGLPM
jgi:hypothetical protein